MPRYLTDEVGSIDYGSSSPLSLPRDYHVGGYDLSLTGELVVSSGTNILPEGIARIFKEIKVEAAGEQVLALDGPALAFQHFALNRGRNVPAVQPGGTVATHPFELTLPFLFEAIGTRSPWRYRLDATQYRRRNVELQIRASWATAAELTDGTGAAAIQNTSVIVKPRHYPTLAQGDQAQMAFGMKRYSIRQQDYLAADSKALFALPTDAPIQALLIRVSSTANDGRDLSDTLVTEIEVLERNTYVPVSYTWKQLKLDGQLRLGWDETFGSPTDATKSQGWAIIRFNWDSDRDFFNPQGLSAYDLRLNVAANTRVRVVAVQLLGGQ